MSYVSKPTLKDLLKVSETDFFAKKSIKSIVRAILEPLVEANEKSVVLLKLRDLEDIEGVIKRLEFSNEIEIHNLDNLLDKDFADIEFIFVSSSRFNAFLMWDYSQSENKDKSNIFITMNSIDVNAILNLIKEKIGSEILEKFNSYKPERRANEILNSCISKIINTLNENVMENEFVSIQSVKIMGNENAKEENNAKIRECCHEIVNLLSIIDIHSTILEKKIGEDVNIKLIKKSLELVKSQLNNLREHEEYVIKKEDISDLLVKTCEMMKNLFEEKNNTISLENEDITCYSFIDKNKFTSVILNILKNANESTENDTVKVYLSKKEAMGQILIENHGTPIDKENKDKIFEDGFTTKSSGKGIGLSVCKKYLEKQNCTIELLKSDIESTEFLIKFKTAN